MARLPTIYTQCTPGQSDGGIVSLTLRPGDRTAPIELTVELDQGQGERGWMCVGGRTETIVG